jgi:2-polyprenyl-6-methoxyphenol hydroxylase-like FAD-dependent oxidoreductase
VTHDKTVLISGASIAGPALAYWLRHHGFRPTVVERAPTVRGGGYPIDVRGVAIDVVQRMGVLPQVRAANIDTRRLMIIGEDGRPAVSAGPDAIGGSSSGRDVELPRGDLTAVLHARTKDDVEYVFDDSIAALDERPDAVDVTFTKGEQRTFDLVIGADGLHSNVRGLTFGPDEQYVRHMGAYSAAFSVPNHLGLDREVLLHNAPGRLAALYAVRDRPEPTALFAFASPEIRVHHRDVQQQQQLVENAVDGMGWEVPRLVKAMRDADDFWFDGVSQIRMATWTSGRVAVVGDAAFAPSFMSGQGTSLALVGAYVLAGELAAAGGDHRVAFPAYERELRGFVERNQALALTGVEFLLPSTRPRIWLRNQLMRLGPIVARLGMLGDKVQEAANSLELRTY